MVWPQASAITSCLLFRENTRSFRVPLTEPPRAGLAVGGSPGPVMSLQQEGHLPVEGDLLRSPAPGVLRTPTLAIVLPSLFFSLSPKCSCASPVGDCAHTSPGNEHRGSQCLLRPSFPSLMWTKGRGVIIIIIVIITFLEHSPLDRPSFKPLKYINSFHV